MKKMNKFGKFIVYTILTAGAILFCAPLIWMLSTALKPIDQTMAMPPKWFPYRYFGELNGKNEAVRIDKKIMEPALIVKVKSTGKKMILPVTAVKNGLLIQKDKTQAPIQVETIKEIPASLNNIWVVISPEKRDDKNLQNDQWNLIPASSIKRTIYFRWNNFLKAIKAMKFFPSYLANTLVVCFMTCLGTVTSSAFAAYGFSRIDWKGRDKIFLLALATMMIPFPVIMVPMFCMFRALGMIGTLQPLWVGSFCAGAFNVFLLRQFFIGIPKDLSDAARIDGCNELQIFWQIILPMSKPALMVVGLFQFMGSWNDFLGPLIYLNDQKDYTLALGLQFFQSQSGGTEWNYLMAASLLVLLPVLVLFFFTQKSFIEGISTTGLKG